MRNLFTVRFFGSDDMLKLIKKSWLIAALLSTAVFNQEKSPDGELLNGVVGRSTFLKMFSIAVKFSSLLLAVTYKIGTQLNKGYL